MRVVSIILSTILLIACGSSDPETLIREGYAAQGSGDSKEALSKFNEALEQLAPEDPRYVDAKLGMIEALIADEPGKASEQFLALADDFPLRVGAKEFTFIGGQMISAHRYDQALEILRVGVQRAGENPQPLMNLIERIRMEIASDEAQIYLLEPICVYGQH